MVPVLALMALVLLIVPAIESEPVTVSEAVPPVAMVKFLTKPVVEIIG
jgi:hypothetical protein